MSRTFLSYKTEDCRPITGHLPLFSSPYPLASHCSTFHFWEFDYSRKLRGVESSRACLCFTSLFLVAYCLQGASTLWHVVDFNFPLEMSIFAICTIYRWHESPLPRFALFMVCHVFGSVGISASLQLLHVRATYVHSLGCSNVG